MGHHYVPQFYLKGFTSPSDGFLEVYDRQESKHFRTQVKSIAQGAGFYSEETETYLANEIEAPANPVIEKIRARERVSLDEKQILTRYMVALMKRVPEGKQRLKDFAPEVAASFAEKIDSLMDQAKTRDPEEVEVVEENRRVVHAQLEAFAENPGEEVWMENIPPERTPWTLKVIPMMRWQFFTHGGDTAFMTSDNPVFFFRTLGIGRPESEISFPISSQVALLASWRRDVQQGYFPTRAAIVKEINRRTASNMTRFAYYREHKHWILPFLEKRHYRLNRLM